MDADGVVDKRTWKKLDTLVPGSSMGRVDRFGAQEARGMNFGAASPTSGPKNRTGQRRPDRSCASATSTRTTPTRLAFPEQGGDGRHVARRITKVWNASRAVGEPVTPGAPTRPNVNLQAEEGTPPDKRMVLSQGPGHSNAARPHINALLERAMGGIWNPARR